MGKAEQRKQISKLFLSSEFCAKLKEVMGEQQLSTSSTFSKRYLQANSKTKVLALMTVKSNPFS